MVGSLRGRPPTLAPIFQKNKIAFLSEKLDEVCRRKFYGWRLGQVLSILAALKKANVRCLKEMTKMFRISGTKEYVSTYTARRIDPNIGARPSPAALF
jgi:hypothetical protein